MDERTEGDWVEYRKLVLHELKRIDEVLDGNHKEILTQVELLKADVMQLKLKAAAWGGVAGVIASLPGVVAALWVIFGK